MDPETRELRALEAEVAALQRECSMLPKPWKKTSGARKSFQKFPQSDSEGWESLEDLKSQLGHLKSELSFLSKLTGINIRSYSKIEDITNNEVTDKDTKKILQRHRISGNCSIVTFQLEFQVLEIETKEKLSSVITDLNIIMEPTEYSELSEFASRAEEKRDLLMFFRSLHFFVEWYEYRKNTLEHFKIIITALLTAPVFPVALRQCVTKLPIWPQTWRPPACLGKNILHHCTSVVLKWLLFPSILMVQVLLHCIQRTLSL